MTLAVHLADAGYGWVYVIVGWSLAGVVIAGYFARLVGPHPPRGAVAPAGVGALTTAPPRPTAQIPPPPPRSKKKRTRYIVAAGGLRVSSVIAVIVLTFVLSENVVYLPDRVGGGARPLEPGHDRGSGSRAPWSRARSATATHTGVDFEVTDGKQTVNVVHHGDPPELFKNGAPVVCEGHWAPASAGVHVRQRPDPDQARRGVHAAEGQHQEGSEGHQSGGRMRAGLGILGIAIGLGASAVGICSSSRSGSHARTSQRSRQRSPSASSSCSLGALLAVFAMEWALITHDFSIQYVADNNARATPLLFTITGAVGRARGIDPAVGR